jgi:prevent-host-death family protein
MDVSVSEAKGRLTQLVRRAEGGEEVILTRRGKPAVKLVRIRAPAEIKARKERILEIGRRAALSATPGPDAAHSADYLYDDDGLPS